MANDFFDCIFIVVDYPLCSSMLMKALLPTFLKQGATERAWLVAGEHPLAEQGEDCEKTVKK